MKNRSRQLTELFHSYNTYTNRVGGIETILVTELSHDRRYYVGHTKYYEQVGVANRQGLIAMHICTLILIKVVGGCLLTVV